MRLGKGLRTSTFLLLCILFTGSPAFAKQRIYIGAGSQDCIYSKVAYTICDIIEEDDVLQKDYTCSVVHTSGSMANLQGLAANRLDLAIAQADTLQHAINGTSHFTHTQPNANLGVLLPLYPEPFSILVTQSSNINGPDDLLNKHVNIGKPYADHRGILELVMRLRGLSRSDFASLREDVNDQALFQKLCMGKIDAVITMSGHPVVNYKPLMSSCELKLISLNDNVINEVLKHESLLFPTQINSSLYSAEGEHAQTFAAMSFLVANENLDPYFSHNLLVALENQEKQLRASHPAMRKFSIAQTPYTNTKELPVHVASKVYFGIP